MSSTWSIITVSYNSANTLRRFWTNPRPGFVEWIVVDNGSSDDSVAVARELGARVIDLGRNVGFSAANNEGLKSASGHYVGFLNPDVRADWDDLKTLASTIDRVDGLVGPQLVNADGSLQPNGRGAPFLLHKVLNRLRPGQHDNGYRILTPEHELRYAFWLMGAAVAGATDTVRRLGGWNERFFLYYEDKDLSIRAWRAGTPIILEGRVRWTHGWARETKSFRLMPWVREVDSLLRFYSLYPEFLIGGRGVAVKHRDALARSGTVVTFG